MSVARWKKILPGEFLERCEVIDSRIVERDPATPRHGKMIGDLGVLLYTQAPALFVAIHVLVIFLEDEHEYAPDLMAVHPDNPTQPGNEYYRGVPDLVMEVLSKPSEPTDRGVKMRVHADAGVRHYWIADPHERTVELYRLRADLRGYDGPHITTFDELSVPHDLR